MNLLVHIFYYIFITPTKKVANKSRPSQYEKSNLRSSISN